MKRFYLSILLIIVTALFFFSAVIGFLLVPTAAAIIKQGDFTFQTPASLGRPPRGLAVEDAVLVDLNSIGMQCLETNQVSWIENVSISPRATAFETTYVGEKGLADLTVIEFESQSNAAEFFGQWSDIVSKGLQISHLEINLPGWLGQGHIQRAYNPRIGKAYNAWQSENWVIIIEVSGPFSQAMPRSQEIKQLVSQSYSRAR
jgi:hypothetical protein